MPTHQLQHFYDGQLRRYILQFTRIFTSFQYETGKNANGEREKRQIPARYASKDRMTSYILRNNSENVVLSAPFITTWVQSVNTNNDRRQAPMHVSRLNVNEREFKNGEYTQNAGNTYSVDRYMPVPYDVKMQVDVWTTNEDQKHQIMEQIMQLFNPSLDIQTSTNPIDWTSLTYVKLDDIDWSSRSIPVGTEEEIDVATLTFEYPVWINPPAKIKKQNLIRTIRKNILDVPTGENLDQNTTTSDLSGYENIGEVVTRGWDILVQGDKITLLNKFGQTVDDEGNTLNWKDVFDKYGPLRSGESQLRLITTTESDVDSDIVGTIQYTNQSNQLAWQIDPFTLKTNTLDSIDAIIDDPHRVYPDQGLPAAQVGQRYLIFNSISGPTQAWGSLTASENSIIQFDGNDWQVTFDPTTSNGPEYTVNTHTQKQLVFKNGDWDFAIDGHYQEGEYRIFLCPD